MNGSSLKSPLSQEDHKLGSINSPVSLLIYGDYEDPETKRSSPVLIKIFHEYHGRLCLAYRHFPLVKKHHNSALAAIAAEAAALQGKFWEMHEKLMASKVIEEEIIFSIAREIELDMTQFLDDIENDELNIKVQKQFQTGVKNNIYNTPTIFINGVRYDGIPPYTNLKGLIDRQIYDHRTAFLGGE